jgi:hypothetical protein
MRNGIKAGRLIQKNILWGWKARAPYFPLILQRKSQAPNQALSAHSLTYQVPFLHTKNAHQALRRDTPNIGITKYCI